MDISSLTNLYPTDSVYSQAGVTAQELGKDDFMHLLVTQLQNQDPFEPVENAEFVSQLAQFSALEQAENTSDNLAYLAALEQESFKLTSLTEGSALIGKEVEYLDYETGETASGKVDALEVIDGLVYLKIGESYVSLSNVTQVSEQAEEE